MAVAHEKNGVAIEHCREKPRRPRLGEVSSTKVLVGEDL